MTRAEAERFAKEWAEAWSARNLDAVLSHYAEDAEFISPKAATIAGQARLSGKAALERYWRAALERIPKIHFSVERILWDAESRELCVVYLADLNGQRARACELMQFRPDGRLSRGEALYGASF